MVEGEEAVLFLEAIPKVAGGYRIVGMQQGKIPVKTDPLVTEGKADLVEEVAKAVATEKVVVVGVVGSGQVRHQRVELVECGEIRGLRVDAFRVEQMRHGGLLDVGWRSAEAAIVAPPAAGRERNVPVTRTSYPAFSPPASGCPLRSSTGTPVALSRRRSTSRPVSSFPTGKTE